MKRILLVPLLFAGWLALEGDASASFLLRHHLHKYSTLVVCRPYNAFTPVCYGSVVCDGCCPAPFCGGTPPCLPQTFPAFMGGPICATPCDPGCLPAPPGHAIPVAMPGPMMMPHAAAPLPQGLPGQPVLNWAPPAQTPPPNYSQTSQNWSNQAVQPAGYYSSYYPNYGYSSMPVFPMYPMPAPAYWYGGY